MQYLKFSSLSLKQWGFFLLVSLVIASCAPPSPKVPDGGLKQALFEDTGFGLGSNGSNLTSKEQGECAVESRYGSSPSAPVSLLVCVSRDAASGERVKYRINYAKPSAGHRIWKIAASYPDKNVADFNMDKLEAQFGTPRRVSDPLALTWQKDTTFLELREDQYGVHFQLWDRSLR